MKWRVVITGLGVVTPVGIGAAEFWSNLTAGRSGISTLSLFDASRFPVRIGGEVRRFDEQEVRSSFEGAAGERDRKVLLGLAALAQAVKDSGLPSLPSRTSAQAGQLHVGVSLESFCLQDLTQLVEYPDLAKAITQQLACEAPLQTPLDRLAALAAGRYGLGRRLTNCSACAAGAQAIGEAFHAVQFGETPLAIAGGADSMLNPLGLGGFSLLRILSAENEHPESACRPFDLTRQGTVLGEGAAFLVLEELSHAQRRGAHIYAEIIGYGSSMDAFRLSDPEPGGRGAAQAMRAALADAALAPRAVDCVNAHATGTPKNDAVETAAIKEVLGARAAEIPVHAVKSMTGHLIAASGAVEAAAAVLTLVHRTVPPTINLRRRDPQCDLDYCADGARRFEGETILSNSFGFGGQNATLLLKRFGHDS